MSEPEWIIRGWKKESIGLADCAPTFAGGLDLDKKKKVQGAIGIGSYSV
jgi:hypothetical protein